MSELNTNNFNSEELNSQLDFNKEEVRIDTKSLNRRTSSHSRFLKEVSDKTMNSFRLPKENMNNFFYKLQSASKLKILKAKEDKQEEVEIIQENPKKQERVLVNHKHSLIKPRNTALLDEKMNVMEILKDKDNLLITDSNMITENYSDSSKDEINLGEKDLFNKISMTDFKNSSMDDLKSEDFSTFHKKVGINKERILNLNELGKAVYSAADNSLKKIAAEKSNNKKPPNTSRKSVNKQLTKSTDMSFNKNNISKESNTASTSTKFSLGSKGKASKTPVTSSTKKVINPFTVKLTNNKVQNTVRAVTPVNVTRTQTLKSRNNSQTKNFTTSSSIKSKSPIVKKETTRIGISHSSRGSETSIINYRTKYEANLQSTLYNTIDEYDYSKILVELKQIFGDNLELFDEHSNFIIKISVIFKSR
jgi:hypothetical protein